MKVRFHYPLLLLTASCVNTPLPELPVEDTPDAWIGPIADEARTWPEADWWNSFESDELSNLIALVEDRNLDLANNRRNLRAAQLSLRDAGFNLYPIPVLDAGLSERYIGLGVGGADYTDSTTGSADVTLGFTYNNILSKPDQYDAAIARWDSSVALAADVRLNTLGTAASTYFSVLLLRDRVDAGRRNLANAEQIERIVRARVDAGTVAPIDALQQRIAVQRIRNNIQSLIQDELAARSSLALLLADSVQDTNVQATTLEDILVPRVQPGLPSELLVRRPDIVQAESNLRLSRANADLVRHAYLPNVSLTGSASLAGTDIGGVFDADDMFVNVTASLAQTILDNGQRGRNRERARLELENSLADYRKTVLRAFNDIDVTLSNIELLDQLAQFAVDDLARAEEAFRIAEVRYREGVEDFQTVLLAQNTLFDVRNNYYNNKLARLNAIVSFYQALGGGWHRDLAASE